MTPEARAEADATAPVQEESHRAGPLLWACLLVGWAVIVFALHGMISNPSANPPHLFRLLVGLNVVNDALLIPAVIVVAVAARRVLPHWLLLPAQVGLITSAVVALYAYPLVRGFGRTAAAGPSRLPWNYSHGLLMVLGAIWLGCGLLALWSWRRTRTRPA